MASQSIRETTECFPLTLRWIVIAPSAEGNVTLNHCSGRPEVISFDSLELRCDHDFFAGGYHQIFARSPDDVVQ